MGIGLVVIVIFLVVWIISNVLRAQQDAAQVAAKRTINRPIANNQAQGAAKGNTEIDRFLQEIDRLRRKGEQEKTETQHGSASKETLKPVVEPIRLTQAAAQQKRQAQQERKKKEQQSRRPSVREPSPVRPVPLPATPTLPALPRQPEPAIATPVPHVMRQADVSTPMRISAVARPMRPTQAASAVSPAIETLATLFKSQQGSAVAILLHEILGKPKCRQ